MQQTQARPARLLVVDDDPLMRVLVDAALTRAGHDVIVVPNGYQALNVIEDQAPDLVITDVDMPGLSGFELVVRLRADPATAGIPVLFLTGSAVAPSDIGYGLSLGADDYLLKPVDVTALLAQVQARLHEGPNLPAPVSGPPAGILSSLAFSGEVARAALASASSGRPGVVCVIEVVDLPAVEARFGVRASRDIGDELAVAVAAAMSPGAIIGRAARGRLLVLEGDVSPEDLAPRLQLLAERLARRSFATMGEHLHVTPAIGMVEFTDDSVDPSDLVRRARMAAAVGVDTLDLRPHVWTEALGDWIEPAPPPRVRRPRTVIQFVLTLVLGILIPLIVYVLADRAGIPLARYAYVVVVMALLLTGAMIWIEGFLALRPVPIPQDVHDPPPASAIIAAYLPNEAATIMDTLEAFLRVEYDGDLQVMLAYNTPTPLPIEAALAELAEREPRIEVLKVEASTSKAQNVNAALSHVRGEFVGVFDADHHPARDAFQRAWQWLGNGYDVVQGHCVVRNGEASRVARTIAVEFEAIYAVSHPGRARLHDFGIFGGSNGYWRTELLRATRMRGSMLTEDIDSSMRVVEAGGRIASDRDLLSRELAPTTLTGLWNQRMRWAQGWFQVSLRHLWSGWRSPSLSLRQKFGFTFLLGWREVYPWLAIQMIPIVIALAIKAGGVNRLDWLLPLFVLTTLFMLAVGPGQTYFAYRLGAPDVTRHRAWFWQYLLTSTLVYAEFKNTINRIAQLKEFFRERAWRVTPRSS